MKHFFIETTKYYEDGFFHAHPKEYIFSCQQCNLTTIAPTFYGASQSRYKWEQHDCYPTEELQRLLELKL